MKFGQRQHINIRQMSLKVTDKYTDWAENILQFIRVSLWMAADVACSNQMWSRNFTRSCWILIRAGDFFKWKMLRA